MYINTNCLFSRRMSSADDRSQFSGLKKKKNQNSLYYIWIQHIKLVHTSTQKPSIGLVLFLKRFETIFL